MKKVKLINLVNKDVAGIEANVVCQGGKYHFNYQDTPKIRTLEKVYFKEEKGVKWIYWTWKKEAHHQGGPDCGYSGIADSELHRLNEAYIYCDI